jgi:hypothetical protein
MPLRRWLSIVLLAPVIACDALTDPGPTRTNVLFEGELTWGICSANGCQARIESHNLGPGCARDPFGIFRLLDETGRVIFSADWERPGMLRPDEKFDIVVDGVPVQAVILARTYQTQGWWVAAQCRST